MKKQIKFIIASGFSTSSLFLSPITYLNSLIDKKKIFKDNKKKSGIYCWVNNINGNKYVGSSVNLSKRLYKYFDINHLNKSNRVIDRALLKHGHENFTLEILEYCDKDILLEREQYYLDLLNPEYCVVKLAGNTLGYKHTEESIEKMINYELSDEEKKQKAINVVKYATEANKIPIIVENILTKVKTEYSSIREAGLSLSLNNTSIGYALRKQTILKKIYKITKK